MSWDGKNALHADRFTAGFRERGMSVANSMNGDCEVTKIQDKKKAAG
jgi:hypothetical protein